MGGKWELVTITVNRGRMGIMKKLLINEDTMKAIEINGSEFDLICEHFNIEDYFDGNDIVVSEDFYNEIKERIGR
jgi:hypothetical protein